MLPVYIARYVTADTFIYTMLDTYALLVKQKWLVPLLYLVLPFRLHNSKVLSCGQMFNATSLSPRERLTCKEKWQNHNCHVFHLLWNYPHIFPSPSTHLTLTTAGVAFFLKLPVGVGRSGGCFQNAMVRMTLATVDYKTVWRPSFFRNCMVVGFIWLYLPSSTTAWSSAKEPSAAT